MKKKLLTFILTLVAMLMCIVGFSACSEMGDSAFNTGGDTNTEQSTGDNTGETADDSEIDSVGNSEDISSDETDTNSSSDTDMEEDEGTVGLRYELIGNGDEYRVVGLGTATDVDIVIPSKYNGLQVTSIGGYAFSNCKSLTSVAIGDSVTSIGEYAFV